LIITRNPKNYNMAEIEVKLFINKNLYLGGSITEEMFEKAKDMILKQGMAKDVYSENMPETVSA